MRKLLIFISIGIILSNCTSPEGENSSKTQSGVVNTERDSFSLLCQYWDLDEADNPSSVDISMKDPNTGIEYKSGILFMPDSTVLENPKGKMTYGKFSLNNQVIDVTYDDGR
ncbi:MAG: hypothetical protein ABIN48_08210, partial [Ginsengibacter sp.]